MEQNYSNHRRFLPIFHFFVLPILLMNVIYQAQHTIRHFSWATIVAPPNR